MNAHLTLAVLLVGTAVPLDDALPAGGAVVCAPSVVFPGPAGAPLALLLTPLGSAAGGAAPEGAAPEGAALAGLAGAGPAGADGALAATVLAPEFPLFAGADGAAAPTLTLFTGCAGADADTGAAGAVGALAGVSVDTGLAAATLLALLLLLLLAGCALLGVLRAYANSVRERFLSYGTTHAAIVGIAAPVEDAPALAGAAVVDEAEADAGADADADAEVAGAAGVTEAGAESAGVEAEAEAEAEAELVAEAVSDGSDEISLVGPVPASEVVGFAPALPGP